MPRKSLSSFDLKRLIEEISFLNGGIVRGVKSRKNELYILIFSKGEFWLKIVPGKYVSVSRNKPDDTVDYPFTSKLKSEISGRRIMIDMHGSDRIVEIRTDEAKLVCELFSNGNITLIKDGTILMSMFTRRYGTRMVASGEEYTYPESRVDPFSSDYEKFHETIIKSDRESLVKAIAIDLSLGGLYAEELCYRANADKSIPPSKIDDKTAKTLFSSFREMLSEPLHPSVINHEILAVIDIKHLDSEREYYPDIDSAVKAFFSETVHIKESSIEDKTAKIKTAIEGYENVIAYLNNNYPEIEGLLNRVKDSKVPIDKRRLYAEENGWRMEGKFLTRNDNNEIKIDITHSLRSTLSSYHEKVKKLKDTLLKKKTSRPSLKKLPLMKEEVWYSKFRWSKTSGGCTVIVGKDNNQNVSLLEKHTDKDDIVLHADIFGSPFGIVKAGSEHPITKKDIEEGATLVASYSSAWKAGAGNIDVYSVHPEQVTKSAPSGEYLKKGAFYIEGKREYLKGTQLELYICISVTENGYSLTASAYRTGNASVIVRPGNKKRDDIIKKIIRIFGERTDVLVKKDAVDKLLPSGKASLSS